MSQNCTERKFIYNRGSMKSPILASGQGTHHTRDIAIMSPKGLKLSPYQPVIILIFFIKFAKVKKGGG